MAVKNFSDTWIKNLKPGGKRVDHHEGRGFYLRVQPTGKKAFYYIYRAGKIHTVKIGDYPAMKLAEARKRHNEMVEMRENGLDPSVEIQAERKGTFGELVKDYLKRHAAKNKERHRKENQRILDVDVLPFWENRSAGKIRRSDAVDLLNRVLDRGAHRQANKTLACVRKVFNYGLSNAWPGLEYNPCARMTPPGNERRVERVLTDKEILTFWKHFDESNTKKQIVDCLKFILATGLRMNEALFIEWKEIDDRWLTVPTERMKNNRPHRTYLNDVAMELLDDSLPMPFPFPSHVSGLAQALRRQFTNINKPLTIPKFTPKDLRRTAATNLGKLGYKNADIGKLLSHTDTSVTSVYNLHEYDELKQEMSEAWGKALQLILDNKEEEKLTS
ncbi:MAG: integrase family protein [Desulfuromonadales bacterium]|nr:integrase family protein [Desulfuromonadales bacterium]